MNVKLFHNANIYTPHDPGHPLKGADQSRVERWNSGAVLCCNGCIEAVGDRETVLASISPAEIDLQIDCRGLCLVPGFVDPHTHLCFLETREEEFNLRVQGTPYLEILKRGGGILSTVRSVRKAPEERLLSKTGDLARSALSLGTTTIEVKSGYGLDTETELKMLRVIDRLDSTTPLDVVPTFLGAHVVPEEYSEYPDAYVDLVIHEMIPAVAEQNIARFCDVFCEEGVFSVDQSRRILLAAQQAGMGLKIHADEVYELGGAGLAAELKAVSAEHLLVAGDRDLESMARSGVIAVLLPGTALCLQKPFARARRMIELDLALAMATDCNPGSCYSESVPLAFTLAVFGMNLSPQEALVAVTLNAAYAVGMADRVGSLDVGKQADFVLLDGASPAVLAYHAGVNPVVEVYKKGERVV